MSFLAWLRPPCHLLALFLAVTLAPAAGLIWLGWRLLEQDRALEAQRMLERRENAADLAVAALGERLATVVQRLPDAGQSRQLASNNDCVAVILHRENINAYPAARLLYYPVAPLKREVAHSIYQAGEQYEFRDKNYARAIDKLRELARSGNPAIRAGAQLRIARNYRKAGNLRFALTAYKELAGFDGVFLEGTPAELVARRARCALLAELGRKDELQREAKALYDDLLSGRWRLTRPVFQLHAAQLREWLGADNDREVERLALSAAVEWLWGEWQDKLAGGRNLPTGTTITAYGRTLTVLSDTTEDRVTSLIAGPRYVETQWLQAVAPILKTYGVQICLRDAGGNAVHGAPDADRSGQSLRLASDTGLPWTVLVANADVGAVRDDFASRRRLLLAGLGLTAILILAVAYLIARAVSRELAVARLKSDFVAAVSHEFRTPLATLRQLTENLADGRVDTEERRQAYYQGQVRATSRLSRLVERLLDFGRMEAGALRHCPAPLDLGELVRSVVDEFEHVAATTGHHIELAVDPSLPPVLADRETLGQAVWNLLDNAIKYSPARPAVWIEVGGQDGHAAVRVRDEGPGIPPEEQKNLFRKFVRGSAAREAGVKGTGIGLAMVQYIVRAHQGRVRVESEPGQGSTFTILLKTESP